MHALLGAPPLPRGKLRENLASATAKVKALDFNTRRITLSPKSRSGSDN
jgi:hypothetical protein